MLLLLGLLLLGGLLRGLSLLRFLRHAALLAVSWLAMSQQCNRESTALHAVYLQHRKENSESA
jgi:hypothetical protein